MTTDTKPTKEKVKKLRSSLQSREDAVKLMRIYHRKRVEFFGQWNLFLNATNAFAVVGALSLTGLQLADQTDPVVSIKTSLLAATSTVLFLFFSMLLDLTRKEEKHRWLEASYQKLNQKFSMVYFATWKNLTEKEYEKLIALFHRIKDNMIVLKAEEPPILQFELFLANQRRNIKGEKEIRILKKITRWQYRMAGFFSRTNALSKFLANHNHEEHEKLEKDKKKKIKNKKKKTKDKIEKKS